MSLTAFKRKSVINYGSKRSGIAPGGFWLPQGPFGHSTKTLKEAIQNYGTVGFSINGGSRNIGGVGRDMKMSKSGTPYRGTQPIGFGGTFGKYPSATLIGNDDQTTYGMLDRKYRWARYGKYPNYWVQPNYTGNQTATSSQGLYVQNLAAANTCSLNVNNVGTYEGNFVGCGPTLCTPGRSTARFKFNDMVRNAPYTKTLYQPVSYSQYNLYLTRGCNNPIGPQKPFPFAVQTGSSQAAAGTSITSFASGCGTSNVYLTPPEWYTEDSVKPNGLSQPPQTLPF